MNPDLQAFVRDALARGVPRDRIRGALRDAGWPDDEIEPALAAWADGDFPIPVPRRRPYLSARETFLYLAMFVTLYLTAFNVGAILFECVERWVPDVARRGFEGRFSADRVRGAVAAVLIAYPIFLALARTIGRAIAREPEKRASRIRKWLTYLTLFVAALVIIGDLTFLVSRLLAGELPPRFVLKTLVVFAIAAVVFDHYVSALRRDEDASAGRAAGGASWRARAAATAVFATLAAGFTLAGSPGIERHRQLDLQRVDDLRSIGGAVSEYFREHRALPDSLGALTLMPFGGPRSTEDPVTRAPYGYRALDSLGYELCATFDREDLGETALDPDRPPRFWRHPAGRACFTLRVSRVARDAPAIDRP